MEPYILTPKGLKRIPADKGQPAYDVDWDTWIKPNLPATYSMDYIGNNGTADPGGTTKINEAQDRPRSGGGGGFRGGGGGGRY